MTVADTAITQPSVTAIANVQQMTTLADTEHCVANKHVTAEISSDKITMLYQVKDGPCLQSFGIHVAAMAGAVTAHRTVHTNVSLRAHYCDTDPLTANHEERCDQLVCAHTESSSKCLFQLRKRVCVVTS
jgi:MutS domain V